MASWETLVAFATVTILVAYFPGPALLYTAALQTADWGAPIGPGQSLAIGIYQLSALIGRGAGRSVTLTF